MAAIHELTRDNVSVQRAVDFEDLVAAARILVRVHEADSLGVGLRWWGGVVPVLYSKKRTCIVCHGAWPCWRARWAASTLSTLDGVWRDITGEDLASEYGYTAPPEQLATLYEAEPWQVEAGSDPGLDRRAG
jgi:hypothetical protein